MGFWNVRGLNNPIKQQEIRWFLHQNKIGLFGLLETKIKGSNWLKVDILSVTAQGIHPKVFDKSRKIVFCITETKDRIGGAEVSWAEMAPMRSMVLDCQLYDMKASGSYYTWNNKHEDATRVYSRIDRVLMNDQWFGSFPEAIATFSPEGLYDHCPCLINTDAIFVKRKTSFKYYNMWALFDDFAYNVENSWYEETVGTLMFRVVHKLKKLKPVLQQLNKDQFSDIENLTHVTELALKHFQQQLSCDPLNDMVCHAERECAQELRVLIKARNSYLAQKAKEIWVREGDANTSFFHSSIKKRRMRNRVYNVKDMDGNLCSTPEEIKTAFEKYYMKLLGTSNQCNLF
ncbi:uncharacterized protein LOC141613857 [Silene latifolia]|uniref:uncharacterized protein LOC141613857 n=1 Tax=Silene latifolia TaxID=37657 RepID=UPI003D77C8FB